MVPTEGELDFGERADSSDRPGTAVCAIDLGSRNFKAVVGRVSGGAIVTRLLDKVRLDLGEHLAENRGSVSEAKIAEILDALDALAARGRAEGASKVLAVGTRALREARNAGAVVHAARAAGIEIEVASGEREAELGYLCATGGAPNRLVSDLGSQSLEIAWKTENAVESRCVDPGYVGAWLPGSPALRVSAAARAEYDAFLARCTSTTCPGEPSSSSASHPIPRRRMSSGGRRRRSPTARSLVPRSMRRSGRWNGFPPPRGASIATRWRGRKRFSPGSWCSIT